MTPHNVTRQSFKWGTYGKSGRDPLKFLPLYEVHDDHLVNIIIMMREYPGTFNDMLLNIMLTEQEYRRSKKIRVPFKFG